MSGEETSLNPVDSREPFKVYGTDSELCFRNDPRAVRVPW